MLSDKETIDRLGAKKVAVHTGSSISAVCHWRTRGIPWRLRRKVAELANTNGIVLTLDFLDNRP